jgi:hypothetical protein
MMISKYMRILKAAEMENLNILSQQRSGKYEENQKNVNQDSW